MYGFEPIIVKSTSLNRTLPRGEFPFPCTQTCLVAEHDGQCLGHVNYSVIAVRDRVYINKIEVEQQRQGVGLTLLWHLWQIHRSADHAAVRVRAVVRLLGCKRLAITR